MIGVFLTKEQLEKEFDQVFYQNHFNDIPFMELNLKCNERKYNGYNFLSKGDLKQYLIEPFRLFQPKTYQQMLNAEFFYAIQKSPYPQIMSDITQFGIIVNHQCFYISYPPIPCYEQDPDSIFYKNLPTFILNSWILHTDAWHIAESEITNPFRSRLPSVIGTPINSVISDFENKKNGNHYCDFLDSKFNHCIVRDYDDDRYAGDNRNNYFELRNLLDTRNIDNHNNIGFQLFCSSIDNGENIYIIQNADVFSIKKLYNPQEVIDSYAEHIFLAKDREFDFTPYMVDF